jgi:hypothetical protein
MTKMSVSEGGVEQENDSFFFVVVLKVRLFLCLGFDSSEKYQSGVAIVIDRGEVVVSGDDRLMLMYVWSKYVRVCDFYLQCEMEKKLR